MPNIRDHDASVYLKVLGDELHIGGYEANPIFIERVSMIDFNFWTYLTKLLTYVFATRHFP